VVGRQRLHRCKFQHLPHKTRSVGMHHSCKDGCLGCSHKHAVHTNTPQRTQSYLVQICLHLIKHGLWRHGAACVDDFQHEWPPIAQHAHIPVLTPSCHKLVAVSLESWQDHSCNLFLDRAVPLSDPTKDPRALRIATATSESAGSTSGWHNETKSSGVTGAVRSALPTRFGQTRHLWRLVIQYRHILQPSELQQLLVHVMTL
jgi:hypothetical protein